MYNNEILDHLHTVREQIAKEYSYDLKKLFSKYRAQQELHPDQYYYGYHKTNPEIAQVSEPKKEELK